MNSVFDKPYALSMGPPRCGAQWLRPYLQRRGDICLPYDIPEIFFFDRHFQRGPEFYHSHFHPTAQHRLVMEVATTAFDSPDAPRHVQNLLGKDITLICPLRHPVERARIVYLEHIHYGIVSGGIAEAVEQAPQILFASRYADNLERWIDRFGRERLHVLFYETLEKDRDGYTRELCEALSIPFIAPPGDIELPRPPGPAVAGEKSSARPHILDGFKGAFRKSRTTAPVDMPWLQKRLSQETEKLETLLGHPIPLWKH